VIDRFHPSQHLNRAVDRTGLYLAVHVSPVPDLDDRDDALFVVDFVQDTKRALPHAIPHSSGQLLAPAGARVVGKVLNPLRDPNAIPLAECAELLDGRGLDPELIAHRSPSSP
jgi:hypothetical protein